MVQNSGERANEKKAYIQQWTLVFFRSLTGVRSGAEISLLSHWLSVSRSALLRAFLLPLVFPIQKVTQILTLNKGVRGDTNKTGEDDKMPQPSPKLSIRWKWRCLKAAAKMTIARVYICIHSVTKFCRQYATNEIHLMVALDQRFLFLYKFCLWPQWFNLFEILQRVCLLTMRWQMAVVQYMMVTQVGTLKDYTTIGHEAHFPNDMAGSP